MSIYDAQKASARILIAQKGLTMTLQDQGNNYTASGGRSKNISESEFVGVLLPATKNRLQNFGIDSVQANTNLSRITFLIASSDQEIIEGKKVIVNSKKYIVIGSTVVDPDDTGAIIWKAGLRSE